MSDLDLTTRLAIPMLVGVFTALWRLAIVYRVTSMGYVYRSRNPDRGSRSRMPRV